MTQYGSSALDYARELIEPYLSASPEQIDLLVLWCAYTHAFDQFATAPRLTVRSVTPGAGKSTVLSVAQVLAKNGEKAGHSTGPSLYSLIESEHPTLLLDEVDNMFSSTGFSRANPTLQAILNDGYTSDGFVRVMRSGRSAKMSVFAPVAFAGIGALPAAMASRAIPLMMKIGSPAEYFDPNIEGEIVSEANEILTDWLKADSAREFLRACDRRPEIPGVTSPRVRQIVAPLLAVAALAGNGWLERAYAAVRFAFLGVTDQPELTRFQLALRDALTVWPKDVSFMTGAELADRMAALPSGLWKSLSGEGRTGARRLAMLLKATGVESSAHRIEGQVVTSYSRDSLVKATL